jgi:hypothetical protein
LASKCVAKGAIIALNLSMIVCGPEHFKVTNREAEILCKAFSYSDPIRSSGIYFSGTKYLVLRADDKVICGMRVSVYEKQREEKRNRVSSLMSL